MRISTMATGILTALTLSLPASASEVCEGFGPQTTRDIAQADGENAQLFPFAPASADMNLCNIHTHTNAEHKGPGFSVFAGAGEHGGFQVQRNRGPDRTGTDAARRCNRGVSWR